MIERDLTVFLLAQTAVTSLCNKIYPIQAPKDAMMPYIIIEPTGGNRRKIGNKTDEIVIFRITVDCGPSQIVTGRNIIEAILDTLENRRGVMNLANDLVIEDCSAIRGWAGMSGTYRFMFDGRARHLETRNNP